MLIKRLKTEFFLYQEEVWDFVGSEMKLAIAMTISIALAIVLIPFDRFLVILRHFD